jgi:integrase
MGKLQPLQVERLVTPGKYADGDGLYFVVAGASARSWSYRYWFNGKERWYGLGSFETVPLRDARLARDAARLRVKGDRNTPGVDIVEEKRTARQQTKAVEETGKAKTFEECAQAYVDKMWNSWSGKHRAQWPSSLKTYAYPTIGALTIAEIKPSHIHKLLAPIWIEKRETANRVRGRIETIIAANVDLDNPPPNPAALTKVLREALPKRPKRAVQHHPALPYADMPQFMIALSGAAGRAATMLRFLIFTACRTNEVVEGGWSEIDLAGSIWRIPGARMKMDQDHHVPLSAPALAVLDELRDGSQGQFMFPNEDGQQFSENAMLAVLARLGYGHVTVHGFRSTFATWAEECTEHPDGVREAALAHKYKSETTAAYQRGQKLEKRRRLMDDWADFITGANVVRLRA